MALPAPSADTAALVTGASSGIGIDLARELARRGHNLVLVARRKQKLDEVAAELRATGVRVETLDCDLIDPGARDALPGRIEELGLTVTILVNNAGYGSGGRFVTLDAQSEAMKVRLNCETPVALASAYAPKMAERRSGAILNVASSAGFQPLPNQATYGGTKAFMLHWSEALHAELGGEGVAVTALCPGPVHTEFADTADIEGLFEKAPDFTVLSSAEVAKQAIEGLEKGRRVVDPGFAWKGATLSGRYTPRAALLPMMNKFWR